MALYHEQTDRLREKPFETSLSLRSSPSGDKVKLIIVWST